MKQLLSILFLSLLFLSCSKEENLTVDERLAKDVAEIEAYIKANNLTALRSPEDIFYVLEVPGGAEKPKLSNSVTVNYKGYTLDGKSFDQNNNITFPLLNVIAGWQIGIPKFGKGGKGKIFIPSFYAYGPTRAINGINNAVLAFDIELLDFK